MGGQDGYSRNVLAQNTESNTALAGIVVKPSDSFDLGFDLTWTESTQSLDPFELRAPDYEATHPSMSFDFSQSHTYSAIDVTQIWGSAYANVGLTDDVWMNIYYRYGDYSDDVVLFQDDSGSVSILGAYVGWSF
jgi:hypothetical protein